MMTAKQLQAEIEESLLRGASIAMSHLGVLRGPDAAYLSTDEVNRLMRERAASLAQAYAGRVLTESEADRFVVELGYDCACPLCRELKQEAVS